MASKAQLIKKIETIKGKVMDLWGQLEQHAGNECQTIGRELNQLQKKIEQGLIKPRK